MSSRFQFSNFIELLLSGITNVEELAASLSYWFKNTNEDMQNIIANDSINKRMELMEQEIVEYVEVAKVTTDANSAREQEYKDLYRESAIKKQMEYLQKELDDMHPENVTDIQRFETKIKESGMNEDARKEADKVLNRLKQEGHQSAETGMLYDYLDFVTGLSWKKESPKFIDLTEAERILNEDHYGLDKVKKRIIQQIAVMNLKGKQSGSILLFVGAPGTGKTSIAKSVARALNREYVRISLGGIRDEAEIRGHRRTYVGAMPGRIMDAINKTGVSNPVMVLDEIDKLSQSYNGDPASALFEVLDPEQNNTFTDHYMNVPYDLSDVLFICTANSIDTIPAPLLNRMEVISFAGYTPDEKLKIAREHLLPKSMEDTGLKPSDLEVSDEILNEIISDYTREAGVRGLRKRIDSLCRGAAVMIARGENEPVTITVEQLRTELDMRPVHHDTVPESQNPGVVTGLAWTQVGGEILFIETSISPSKSPSLTLTGNLGDVMKESATIAYQYIKAHPELARMDPKTFSERDLHVHVPEGAVPKDGPSAGITMVSSMVSALRNEAVKEGIAMTGEMTLRGRVLPVGGIKEKILAAKRAGVKTIIISEDNRKDIEDIKPIYVEGLEFVYVKNISDVIAAIFV